MKKLPLAIHAWSENRIVFIELLNGRIVCFSASKFSRLEAATDEQLAKVTSWAKALGFDGKKSMKIIFGPRIVEDYDHES